VEDAAGNRTTVGRKIRYLDPVCPEIHLLGDHTVYMTCGGEYSEPGWTAIDNVDGDLTDRVRVTGQVDKYLAGSYQLTYRVYDDSGNAAESYRTVVVQSKNRPETVKPSGKVIYLTFDDGPGSYTRQLLEVLEAYGAKATFFVVNTEATGIFSEIVEGGHSIGIHSVTHDYREIYASADAYFNDILTMQQIIYEETGVMTYLMRFPGGSSNTVSRFNEGIMTYLTQAVQDMGFCYFDWNVDSMDAGGARSAKDVFENVKDGVSARRISIVLQHDIKGFSVEAVEKILIWGIENGYKFLALDMTSPTSHHGVNN
jgi:peptidoglycan/xylan/chitin deacetylase (PgdA/CDA1 family)